MSEESHENKVKSFNPREEVGGCDRIRLFLTERRDGES